MKLSTVYIQPHNTEFCKFTKLISPAWSYVINILDKLTKILLCVWFHGKKGFKNSFLLCNCQISQNSIFAFSNDMTPLNSKYIPLEGIFVALRSKTFDFVFFKLKVKVASRRFSTITLQWFQVFCRRCLVVMDRT